MNEMIALLLESGLEVKFSAKIDWDKPETNRYVIYVTNNKGTLFSRRASTMQDLEGSLRRALVAEGAAAWGKIKTTEDPESGDLIHEMVP